jgi:beta-glucosidase
VDASVRRILTLKAELELLDRPYPDTARVRDFAAPSSREAARRAARESMTLLQNDSLLPLRPDMRVLVTGPAAASLTALNGGWTYTWQGTDATQFPAGAPTILDAIRRHAARVTYVPGSSFDSAGDVLSAARAAREADVAVVVIGEDAYAEWVGDIRDLTLPEPQLRLVEAVQATGTPTVLVLVEGRPRVISRVADGARAILMAYQPGMEGAGAIADVLFGTVNPSGKLPFTYPRQPDALDTYDHRLTEESGTDFARGPGGFDPQFEFGRGLSYTTFSYAGLALGRDTLRPGESQTIEVTVRNTGNREGTETVLLFSHQHYASIAPPLKRLRDFQRVTLVPGEARTVRFTLPAEALSFVGHDGRRVLEPGAFDVLVGGLRATFQLGLPAIPAAPLPPPAAGGTP